MLQDRSLLLLPAAAHEAAQVAFLCATASSGCLSLEQCLRSLHVAATAGTFEKTPRGSLMAVENLGEPSLGRVAIFLPRAPQMKHSDTIILLHVAALLCACSIDNVCLKNPV